MELNRSVNISLLISMACHFVLIFYLPSNKLLGPEDILKPLEVSYYKVPFAQRVTTKPTAIKRLDAQPAATKKIIKRTKKLIPPKQNLKQESIIKKERTVIRHQPTEKVEVIQQKQNSQLQNQPSYINYFESVREKIKTIAKRNCPGYFRNSEVLLNFVVLSNGRLKQAKILEDSTNAGNRLRNIAIRSIREASPFSSFPEDIDLPELEFKLVISFQNQ